MFRLAPILEFLSVMGSSELETLDVTNNPKLTQLIALNTGLSTIDLSNNTNLTYLSVTGPNLTNVDLSMPDCLGDSHGGW